MSETRPRLPFRRKNILDIAPGLRNLADHAPISKVQTLAGDDAWLVTSYQEVKALLTDDRLGWSHPDPGHAPKISNAAMFGGAADNYDTEKADHARMRRLLTPAFSARRMLRLRSRMQADTSHLLDNVLSMTPPVDLHEQFSFPLPTLMICELLGVPFSDRGRFSALSSGIGDLFDHTRSHAAMRDFSEYIRELIRAKRVSPGTDIISDLIASSRESRIDENEIVGYSIDLLFAGHETTVTRIDFGTVLLLSHPAQCAEFRRDPALTHGAVEEILRMAVPSDLGGLPRYARADIEVAGARVRAGDAVMLSVSAANRDGRIFSDPDRFDIRRNPNPHLSFGHGTHFCLGVALARAQLGIALASLFQRLPNLRLALPPQQLELRSEHLIGGLVRLPVAW
jgi:pentalenolactone synthase